MKFSKLFSRSVFFVGAFTFSIFSTARLEAHPSQLTLISGRPDYNLSWTRRIVHDGFAFIPNPEINYSTQQLSIIAHERLQKVSVAEIINQYGQTTFQLVAEALRFASTRSPVATFVLNADTDGNNFICELLASYPQTAFVVAPTLQDREIRLEDEPACGAPNILRVTELNASLDDLSDAAPFGDTVRIAAPSVNIPTVGWGGRRMQMSGSVPATIKVASALALFASEHHPRLDGESLIDQFLTEQSTILPNLEGKVENARALLPPTGI